MAKYRHKSGSGHTVWAVRTTKSMGAGHLKNFKMRAQEGLGRNILLALISDCIEVGEKGTMYGEELWAVVKEGDYAVAIPDSVIVQLLSPAAFESNWEKEEQRDDAEIGVDIDRDRIKARIKKIKEDRDAYINTPPDGIQIRSDAWQTMPISGELRGLEFALGEEDGKGNAK